MILRLPPRPLEPLRQRRRALRPLLHRSPERWVIDLLNALALHVRQRSAGAGDGFEFVVGEVPTARTVYCLCAVRRQV